MKQWRLLVAGMLAAGSVGLAAPAAMAAGNAVTNPGAETNITGWSTSGSGTGVTLARDTTVQHSGVASFKLTTPIGFSGANAVMNDSPNWVTSSPSTMCTATAWFRGGVSGMQARIQLRAYNGNTNVGSNSTSLVMSDTMWHQLTVTLTVAVGNSIDLNPQFYRPPGSTSGWIDDITEDCSGAPTNSAPTAALTMSPASGTVPFGVTADASGSTDPDGNISTYMFDFGDGSAAVGPQAGSSATHSYTTPGNYIVTTTVTDAGSLTSTATQAVTVSSSSGSDPVLMAAGDIACTATANVGSTSCHQQATANLIAGLNPSVVAPLGDIEYGNWCTAAGLTDNFGPNLPYSPNWGTYKALMRPVPGNHEYNPSDPTTDPTCPSTGYVKGTGYFDYFNGVGQANGPAGDRSLGYYSYDLGSWHIIVLNSEKDFTTTTAGQRTWLQNDLAAHATGCQMVMFHRPRWSSGPHGSDGNQLYSQYIWQDLYQYGVDVVLNGHDHDYERFALQNASGVADPTAGVREFVLGTGGNSHYTRSTTATNSEVFNNDTFGVLDLTLHAGSYDWRFVPEAGKTFTDSGSTNCH